MMTSFMKSTYFSVVLNENRMGDDCSMVYAKEWISIAAWSSISFGCIFHLWNNGLLTHCLQTFLIAFNET